MILVWLQVKICDLGLARGIAELGASNALTAVDDDASVMAWRCMQQISCMPPRTEPGALMGLTVVQTLFHRVHVTICMSPSSWHYSYILCFGVTMHEQLYAGLPTGSHLAPPAHAPGAARTCHLE